MSDANEEHEAAEHAYFAAKRAYFDADAASDAKAVRLAVEAAAPIIAKRAVERALEPISDLRRDCGAMAESEPGQAVRDVYGEIAVDLATIEARVAKEYTQ